MQPFGHPFGFNPTDFAKASDLAALGDVGTYTVATLPAPASWSRRTAWVTDLFADQPIPGGRVVSEGGYWKPIRPLATASAPVSGTSLTLTPLLHSPTQLITGTIAAGMTFAVTYATVGAYPGARFRTIRRASGGLGSVMTILGSTLSLGSWMDHEFDPTTNAWVQTASGGLL